MKRMFVMLILCLTIIGGGLALKNPLLEKKTQHETISTVKEPSPDLSLDVEVLDMEQELVRENIINELYEGELTFEHADPTKKYLIVIKFLDGSKREFVGPDNKPLELEKEVMLGKEEGKVHLVLKGTKTMFKHIQKLKDVRVTAEIIDKN